MNSETKQFLPLLLLAAAVAGMVWAPYFIRRSEHAAMCESGMTTTGRPLSPAWAEKNCK